MRELFVFELLQCTFTNSHALDSFAIAILRSFAGSIRKYPFNENFKEAIQTPLKNVKRNGDMLSSAGRRDEILEK